MGHIFETIKCKKENFFLWEKVVWKILMKFIYRIEFFLFLLKLWLQQMRVTQVYGYESRLIGKLWRLSWAEIISLYTRLNKPCALLTKYCIICVIPTSKHAVQDVDNRHYMRKLGMKLLLLVTLYYQQSTKVNHRGNCPKFCTPGSPVSSLHCRVTVDIQDVQGRYRPMRVCDKSLPEISRMRRQHWSRGWNRL